MRRTMRVVALLALAASSALVAAPGLADEPVDGAPASVGQCGSSQFCVWSNAAYAGTFQFVSSTTVKATGMTTARAVWNRSSKAAVVYSGTSGTGTTTCFAPGTKVSSTTAPAKSFRLLSSTSC